MNGNPKINIKLSPSEIHLINSYTDYPDILKESPEPFNFSTIEVLLLERELELAMLQHDLQDLHWLHSKVLELICLKNLLE